jgi:catechol 2,3-dioxygenase-like lactoylglutathione lyase family enzyme
MTVASTRMEGSTPILRVRSLAESVDHYVGVLGFAVDWRERATASVSRDDAHVMLCEGDQGNPGTWVWIGVDDCERLFAEYTNRGATIRLPPTNYPWAYEIHVEDPDGHVLRFGSEPREDRPFSTWVFWYRGR